jgi:ATP-dependent Clp protease ATP-binding subunit ClpX
MYELPSQDNVTKVVVDEAVVSGDTKPYVIYESEEARSEVEDQQQRPTGSAY